MHRTYSTLLVLNSDMSEQDLAGSSSGKSVLVRIKRKHGTVLLHGGRQYYTRSNALT